MNDFLLFCVVPITILICWIVGHIIENWTECHHDWGKWDDPFKRVDVYSQTRVCKKCNMVQVRLVK